MQNEIRLRLVSANKRLSYNEKYILIKAIFKRNQIKLYIDYICPIVMYAYETWVITKGDEQKRLIFKRKILRKIWKSPTLNPESGNYENRKNEKIEQIYNKLSIQKCVKAKM